MTVQSIIQILIALGVIVFIGVRLAFDTRAYAITNLVLVGMWLWLVVAIAREHRKLVPTDATAQAAA